MKNLSMNESEESLDKLQEMLKSRNSSMPKAISAPFSMKNQAPVHNSLVPHCTVSPLRFEKTHFLLV